MRLHLLSHPFREGYRCVQDGTRKQEHELLAAEPAGAVDLTDFVAQDLGELLQYRVARLVAMRVIHALEAIQITHHAGERLVESLGVLEHLLDSLLEAPPIVESREGIGL
jgi:hypothetical protein